MKYLRRLPKFEYISARSVKEVCSLLEEKMGDAKILAGGTVLLARWKERIGNTPYLIGLKNVADLDCINIHADSELRIGAMATHSAISNSPVVKEKCEILATACGSLGKPQLRNMGTIGGNLCCRLPTAETIPPLIVLGAKVKIANSNGERIVAVEDLSKESLKSGLLAEVQIPGVSEGRGGAYLKYTIREAQDYPTVNVAVLVTVANEKCKDIKIALGAVSPFPLRVRKAEEIMKGSALGENVIAAVVAAAVEETRPLSDMYFSGDYKKEIVKVLTKKAIERAWGKAKTAGQLKEAIH